MSKFPTFDELIAIHYRLIEEFGGSHGLIDIGALDSAAIRPQMGYFQDIFEEAATLMESLAMKHPFVAGNKRVAFLATDTFLRLNGYSIECENNNAFNFFMMLFESKRFRFHNLVTWLSNRVEPM